MTAGRVSCPNDVAEQLPLAPARQEELCASIETVTPSSFVLVICCWRRPLCATISSTPRRRRSNNSNSMLVANIYGGHPACWHISSSSHWTMFVFRHTSFSMLVRYQPIGPITGGGCLEITSLLLLLLLLLPKIISCCVLYWRNIHPWSICSKILSTVGARRECAGPYGKLCPPMCKNRMCRQQQHRLE